ncbi:unnamed protein product, partial [Closterium sp. Yama58-4]
LLDVKRWQKDKISPCLPSPSPARSSPSLFLCSSASPRCVPPSACNPTVWDPCSPRRSPSSTGVLNRFSEDVGVTDAVLPQLPLDILN